MDKKLNEAVAALRPQMVAALQRLVRRRSVEADPLPGKPFGEEVDAYHAFSQHQSIFRTTEAEDIYPAIHCQFPKAKIQGCTSICQTGSVHMDIHAMPMGQIRQSPQLVRLIDSAQLRTLRNIDGSGLRMMLFAEMAQIRTD